MPIRRLCILNQQYKFRLKVDSVAEKALISHGLIPHRWASPYLDILIVQNNRNSDRLFTFFVCGQIV